MPCPVRLGSGGPEGMREILAVVGSVDMNDVSPAAVIGQVDQVGNPAHVVRMHMGQKKMLDVLYGIPLKDQMIDSPCPGVKNQELTVCDDRHAWMAAVFADLRSAGPHKKNVDLPILKDLGRFNPLGLQHGDNILTDKLFHYLVTGS